MRPDGTFEEGDVIAKDFPSGTRRWRVTGWTSEGKLAMQGDHASTPLTAWWKTPDDLPKTYYVEQERMMRVIRSSAYPHYSHGPAPVTLVVRDRDITVTIEEYRQRMLGMGAENPSGKAFVTFDIFSMDEAGIEVATAAAIERLTDEVGWKESNQAVLYWYAVADVLPKVKPHGTWLAPAPAPLSAEQMVVAIEQIIADDAYQHQTLVFLSEDGTRITVEDGEIKEES